MRTRCALTILAAIVLLTGAAQAQYMDLSAEPEDISFGEKEYSPYLHRGYPQRVFWGDTHVHTSYSTDAGMIGCRLGPEEAYRFALGEIVVASGGVRARLQRPLDFLVVADHAENLGLAPMVAEANPDLLKTDFGREIFDLVQSGDYGAAYTLWGTAMSAGIDPLAGKDALTRSMWERLTEAAEKYNPSATTRPRPTGFYHSPTTTRRIPRTCGAGWRPMRRRPAGGCWLSHTMGISPMG
jgi:hypothetical protein